MSRGLMTWILRILRIGFGVLLIVASLDKIQHPYEFSLAVDNYRVVGETLSRWTAVWIPWLEIFLSLLLITGICPLATAWTNFLLMIVFLLLVSQAYFRGLDIECGCFMIGGGAKIGIQKIFENTILTVLAGWVLRQNIVNRLSLRGETRLSGRVAVGSRS
jgi:uncharacterized membrane protein YphA (DoxX/SURF4 family)